MNKLYTKSSGINNTGLFTNKELTINGHVGYISGPVVVFRVFTNEVSRKMLNWIGIGRYSWIDTDKSIFRFINHSCDPNVAQITKRKVIAIKHINKDSELTMDYSLTEAEPDWQIDDCNCGSEYCRGTIRAIMYLPPQVFRKHQAYIPKAFVTLYQNHHKRSSVQR